MKKIMTFLVLLQGVLFAGKKPDQHEIFKKKGDTLKIGKETYVVAAEPSNFFKYIEEYQESCIKKDFAFSLFDISDQEAGSADFAVFPTLLKAFKEKDVLMCLSSTFARTNLLKVVTASPLLIELDIFQIYPKFREKRLGREFLLHVLVVLRKHFPDACVVLKVDPFGVNKLIVSQVAEHYSKCGFQHLRVDKNNALSKTPHMYLILNNETLCQSSAINFSKFRLNRAVGQDIKINYLENGDVDENN